MSALALALLLPLAAEAAPARRAAPGAGGAEIVEFSGGRLLVDGQEQGAGFRPGPGAKIEVNAGGRAVLKLGDAGYLRLDGPALLELSGGKRSAGVFLRRGRLLSVLPGLRGPFQVRTRSIVASVRGTDFFIDARGRQEVYVCTCNGRVTLSDGVPGGFRRDVTATSHEGFVFKSGPSGIIELQHTMRDHTDEDLAALRVLPR